MKVVDDVADGDGDDDDDVDDDDDDDAVDDDGNGGASETSTRSWLQVPMWGSSNLHFLCCGACCLGKAARPRLVGPNSYD